MKIYLRYLLLGIVVSSQVYCDDKDWRTDFSRASIPLEEFVDSGLGKDGFRSLDKPTFETTQQANVWLAGSEPVIAISIEDETKAYPLQILMYHELVNDRLADRAITITYCPLCNAAMIFDRNYAGQELEFGISGQVYASNMVMYDRQTESWWLQFTGKGVVGEFVDAQLELLPSQIVSFEQFSNNYPHGKVLSRETGFDKKYGTNPYERYDSRRLPIKKFFAKPPDPRLPALERVLGIVKQDVVQAYPFSQLKDQVFLQEKIAEQPILIIGLQGVASAVDSRQIANSEQTLAVAAYSRELNGRVLDFVQTENEIIDTQTNSVWNLFGEAIQGPLQGARLTKIDKGVYFAFVWLDFYPQSIIYAN